MSDSSARLRRQIDSATDLQSVVRTMKGVAASSIGQYENSVQALVDYERAVDLGLAACLRGMGPAALRAPRPAAAVARVTSAVVFGSDQGLVGRFNEIVAEHAVATLRDVRGALQVWAVGERVHARLIDAGLSPVRCFPVPTSLNAITPLVGQILVDTQQRGGHEADSALLLFHNSPRAGPTYGSVAQRLLPLDDDWRGQKAGLAWPTKNLPEVAGGAAATLAALIGEHLFVSLFRACAESLASENASRLAAMERADHNIDELLEELRGSFHRLRQSGIDEELFDVIFGFEALNRPRRRSMGQTGPS